MVKFWLGPFSVQWCTYSLLFECFYVQTPLHPSCGDRLISHMGASHEFDDVAYFEWKVMEC